MSTRGAATIILVPLVAFVALASPTTPLPLERDAKSIHPRGFGEFHFLVQYQSSGISFSDWVTLFTLCLAPIVAHLLAGVPEPGMSNCVPRMTRAPNVDTNFCTQPSSLETLPGCSIVSVTTIRPQFSGAISSSSTAVCAV